MNSANGDRSKVEATINHVHLVDLFTGSEFKPAKRLLLRLGEALKQMWASKLSMEFPQKQFTLKLATEGADLNSLELTFYQA